MVDRKLSNEKAQSFFEELWKRGDPWDLETSEFEQAKYDQELAMLNARRYERALEIGCGTGSFTRRLASICDKILALDVSPSAILRAREAAKGLSSVEFREQNIVEFDLQKEGSWDLIVMSETIYYLGWLYSFFDVAWLASQLIGVTSPGGQLLMANTCGGIDDYLLRPWLIRTYHNLLVNVGYEIQSEKIFRGRKNGVDIDVMISLFVNTDKKQGQ
jgi:ubiquinone/menaquinone biosynthesis C-methylase UbiE